LRVLDDLSLDLEAGKVTALVGPNGAGKSTLFHVITGILAPDRGEVWYRQHRIDGLPPYRIARLGVGRLFQDVRVFERLTALENVQVGFPQQVGENPAWALLRRSSVTRQEKANAAAGEQWLDVVGLANSATRPAEELSFGQRKLLAIARLLALGSEVLLLDEPIAGVHPEMATCLVGLMKKLADQGKTVVVIEHNMNVVMESSDWVYFVDGGEVVAFGLPDEVLGNRSIRATYLGL
jgi:ABC-type branched-subunit amino acid transport system ATPase component